MVGGGGSGAEGRQNCSKWQQQKPTISLTYPGRPGRLRAGDRAPGRHKGTMEKLFPSEPAAERRDGAAGPASERGSAAPRGRAPAPGSQPPRVPRREPFPRVSQKCQVLLPLHPACEPSSRRRPPRAPAAQRLFVWLRRAGLRRVEWSPRRCAARGGRTGRCC